MATFGTNNISLNAVRAVLGEPTKSLWALCHNTNINRWAKYSPLTNHGSNISYKSLPVSDPWNCAVWEHVPYNITEARLGDFRQYDHNAFKPVTVMFPEKMYKNIINAVACGYQPTGDVNTTSILVQDVYRVDDKYFGVAIRKKGDTNYSWVTSQTLGGSMVDIDLSKLAGISNGTTIELVTFFSSAKKLIDGPHVMTDFYSVKCDANIIDRKEYTVLNYSPPTNYTELTVNPIPINGIWTYDEVAFDSITVSLRSNITTYYKFKVRIETPDGRYYQDYNMPDVVNVAAGEYKQILNTGRHWLRFYTDTDLVFIKVMDMQASNKVIADIPVFRTIPKI